jgi:hypothetical protein
MLKVANYNKRNHNFGRCPSSWVFCKHNISKNVRDRKKREKNGEGFVIKMNHLGGNINSQ